MCEIGTVKVSESAGRKEVVVRAWSDWTSDYKGRATLGGSHSHWCVPCLETYHGLCVIHLYFQLPKEALYTALSQSKHTHPMSWVERWGPESIWDLPQMDAWVHCLLAAPVYMESVYCVQAGCMPPSCCTSHGLSAALRPPYTSSGWASLLPWPTQCWLSFWLQWLRPVMLALLTGRSLLGMLRLAHLVPCRGLSGSPEPPVPK